MILTEDQLQEFDRDGFLIVDSLYQLSDYEAFIKVLKKILDAKVPFSVVENSEINQALIWLRENNSRELIEIQRLIIRLPEFLRISNNIALMSALKQVIQLEDDNPLYQISNCATFTFPETLKSDQSFHFKTPWHDDIFWTVPKSRFVHIWMPLLNDADEEVGGLKVCVGSHQDDWQGRHQFHPESEFNYRYSVKDEVAAQYEQRVIHVNLGQTLLFHSNLIHSSCANASNDKARVTMLGMYHDALNKDFVAPTPGMNFVNLTPEQWFYELYGDERIKPLIDQQLDAEDDQPSGI